MAKRGDIFFADLNPVIGSEQGGIRPVLIVQNNVGNRYSPTVIAATITSQTDKAKLPTHIFLQRNTCGLSKPSVIQLEQLRTIDKRRLRKYIGTLSREAVQKVNAALSVSCGITIPQISHEEPGVILVSHAVRNIKASIRVSSGV